MEPYLDENTIGVVTTLGLTFTGQYEPVEELCHALDRIHQEKGLDLSSMWTGPPGPPPLRPGPEMGFPQSPGEVHQHFRP